MFRKDLFYLLAFSALTMLAIHACGEDKPPPQAVPAPRLHEALANEKQQNPTRLEKRVEGRQLFSVIMTITAIEDSRIQQHLREDPLWQDEYVECEFRSGNAILHLNIGDQVTVAGKLHAAFDKKKFWPDSKAIKIKDCSLVEAG